MGLEYVVQSLTARQAPFRKVCRKGSILGGRRAPSGIGGVNSSFDTVWMAILYQRP